MQRFPLSLRSAVLALVVGVGTLAAAPAAAQAPRGNAGYEQLVRSTALDLRLLGIRDAEDRLRQVSLGQLVAIGLIAASSDNTGNTRNRVRAILRQ